MEIWPFLQCAQNTKQFISVDSPPWAEQNNINNFVLTCTVVKIFMNKNSQNWWKSPYYRLGVLSKFCYFLQCAQNTKQFISVDSPSWAEQNGTNDFVVACTVVEIFLLTLIRTQEVLWYQWLPNLSKKHITMATCTFKYHTHQHYLQL